MTAKTNLDTKNKTFSRRDALKAIVAASGAVVLTQLPEKWEAPLVEVGVLPAHAQASFVLMVSVSYSLNSGINNCGNGAGSTYDLVITYESRGGNVSNSSQLNVVSTFTPGGTVSIYNGPLVGWPGVSSIGSSSGTLSAALCTVFGAATSNTITVTLTNDIGATDSNSGTASRPPGANSTNNDVPYQLLL